MIKVLRIVLFGLILPSSFVFAAPLLPETFYNATSNECVLLHHGDECSKCSYVPSDAWMSMGVGF